MDIILGTIHGIILLMHGDGTILGIMALGAGVGADLGIIVLGVGDGTVLGMVAGIPAGTAAVAGMAVDIIIVQTIHIPVVLDIAQAADIQLIIIQDAITPVIITPADILHIAEDVGLLLV